MEFNLINVSEKNTYIYGVLPQRPHFFQYQINWRTWWQEGLVDIIPLTNVTSTLPRRNNFISIYTHICITYNLLSHCSPQGQSTGSNISIAGFCEAVIKHHHRNWKNLYVHTTYPSNKWQILGKSFKRHGFPPASPNRAESGSLASSAWHTASCEKSFRGDPVVLSQSDVMSVTTALRSSELVLVLRMITTNTIAAVRQRSWGTPTPAETMHCSDITHKRS